jgi:hypothetical protein
VPHLPTVADIDGRSQVLMDEFLAHKAEVAAKNPSFTHGQIFEGWALQKIAGLQVSLFWLASSFAESGSSASSDPSLQAALQQLAEFVGKKPPRTR